MRSADNLSSKGRLVWSIIRPLVPLKPRWFFEGHPRMRGQLWYADRKLLYDTIRKHKPGVCFEIGTWKGGGSTLFIAQALCENGRGKLHTVEVLRDFYDEARGNYAMYVPHLIPHVEFHLGDYRKIYGNVLQAAGGANFVLFDGAEDAQQTLEQYRFFQPFLKSDTVVMVHDWFTEKAALVRPEIEDRSRWNVLRVLTPPRSVGFAVAVKR